MTDDQPAVPVAVAAEPAPNPEPGDSRVDGPPVSDEAAVDEDRLDEAAIDGAVAMAVRTVGLTKRFGELFAVRDLSLEVPRGSVFGLIGPNGAGKSTTLSILASVLTPTSGSARVAGCDPVTDARGVRRRVGYMPDVLGVYDNLSVQEYLEFFAAAYSLPRAGWKGLVDGLLELVGLEVKRTAMVESLSRGMKQRLALARALVHDPEVLLLDEPASGLDPRARVELRVLLAELQSMGKTIVISSHILSEMEEMCSHIAIMEAGRLLAVGAPKEIGAQVAAAGGRAVVVHLAGGEVRRFHGGRRGRATGAPAATGGRRGPGRGRVPGRGIGPGGRVPPGDGRDVAMRAVLPRSLPPLNPVLARELKQRMRGKLTWLVVTVFLAVLAVILRFVYLGASQTLSGSNFADPLASARVGRSIFHWLLFFMLMLVCFLVPGLTASAISGERERQTLVSLQVTLLRPRSIVLGKLLSSLAFTSFLVIASLPLLSVPFLVGGVSVGEVVKGVVMILLTAVVLACLALACSALLRRTQAATVFAYGLTAALTIGTFIVYGGQRAMDGPINKASPAILALNPFVATADVVQGRNDDSSFGSPFTGLVDLVRPDMTAFSTSGRTGVVEVNGRVIDIRPARPLPAPMTTLAPADMPMPAPMPTVALPIVPDVAPAEAGSPSSASSAAEAGSASSADRLTVTAVGSGQAVAPDAAVAERPLLLGDNPVILPGGGSDVGVFVNGDTGFQQFGPEVERPRAEVLGMRMWVAWLVGSAILGGLALLAAVRRVTLPAARDAS